MFKTESFFIFGLVLVLAHAQQGPPAEPSPSNIQKSWGSYSDFPGLLVNKNPETNIPRNGQNKVEHRNVPNESSGSRAVKQYSGPIVIPGRSRSYSPLTSNVGPKPVPVQASSYSSIPKSVQGMPVAAVAASELAQGAVKPRPPLKTGTDTWTPMGYTGSGKPYEAVIGSPSQQLPYDTANSKQTIGEQIRQRQQQQQQQQQQYDIFGFPINNSPGIRQSEVILKPGVPEIIIQAIDAQNSRRRRRRHAVVYDSTNNINLPKPPKDITFPGRKRPPPPPPLQEEMFQGQHQTQYGSTNSQSRFSSAKQINTNASQKTKTASKAKSVGTSTTENTYLQTNNQKESGPVTKHNLVPSPVTVPASITSKTKPPTKAPVQVIPEAINEPKPTVNPNVPEVQAPSKSNVQPNDHSEAVHHEQNSPEYSPQQINGKANAKVTQEALTNQHDLAPLLLYAEHPTEIMTAEASLELAKLLDYAHREHEHGHSHAHAHDHAHPHTHSNPQTPPSATVQPEKAYKETPVKSKKTVSTKPTRQESATSNTGTNTDANGPPAEMKAKFTSMFDAWYQAKFGAAETTKPPAVEPKQGQEKGSANYQETKATSTPQGHDKNRTPGPKTNSVDKTALFQEFMTMFQDQLSNGETAASNTVNAPYVESKAIPTKKAYIASKATPTKTKYVDLKAKPTKATHGAAKPKSATHVPSEMKAKPTKATPGAAKPKSATHVPSDTKANPTKAPSGAAKPKSATHVPSIIKANQTKATTGAAKPKSATHVPSEMKANPTKATPGASKETASKSKPGSSKTTKVTKAKFGPQKPGAYAITTTQITPSNTEQTNVTNDPTLVELVTLSHPENLSLPNENAKVNPEAPVEVIGPSRHEVIAGMNDVALPVPYAERVPNGRPVKARTRRPKQPKATTTARPMVDPDVLADVNEARVARGEPPLTAKQVDVNGNLLPFYKRQMRIGRLPTRHHPLHSHGGLPMQHQHQHPHPHQHPHQYPRQHQYPMPHQHSEQGNGEAAIGEPNAHSLELHHQAIHMEAGNAMTPNLHRQVHRLLRQRQRGHHRSMYGSYMQIPVITPSPAVLYDPDAMADFLEAQQNRRAAMMAA